MIFKAKNKPKQEEKLQTYLALDIGTEFVKSVIYTSEKSKISVLGYDRTKQSESSMYGAFIINLNDVIDACDRSVGKAIEQAEKTSEKPIAIPKKVTMGIAGELVQGVTVLVNVDRENPDKEITETEVNNIVAKVKQNTFESTKEEIAEEIGIKSSQIEEVNSSINSVYIDGVRSSNAVGFKGAELVYRVFSTFAPQIHLDSVRQVASHLGLEIDQIVVEPYSLSLALENIRRPDASAIFIDIGGGTTDIALVKNGDIIGTRMFAIGGRVFTKRIEKDLGLNYAEAEEMKVKYSDGKLNAEDDEKVRKAVNKDINTWLTGVQLALEDFEDVEEFPTEIYLCGGGALLPEIQEGLMAHPWMQVLNFKKYPKVNFFFPSKVRNIVDLTRTATLPMDVTPLALARMVLEA